MTILESWATYQGYPCKQVLFTVEDGLSPARGYVHLDLRNVKQLKVNPFGPVAWRAVNGQVFDGPASPSSLAEALDSNGTVSESGPAPINADGDGLNEFGDLVLTTKVQGGGTLPQVTYKDIYVDTSQFQELNQGLANQRLHTEGTIVVPLTDVRKFYNDYGIVSCWWNRRMPSGEWDERTCETDESGEFVAPWDAQTVIRSLFRLLPGCPDVVGNGPSHLASLKLDPPVDVGGEGQLVLPILEDLLDRYGLVAKRQPSGNYVVCENGTLQDGGKLATSLGNVVDGRYQHQEQATHSINHVAPAVMVIGNPRIRQITVPCVPVGMDEFGRIYRLEDLAIMWGYPFSMMRDQVLKPLEISFANVPPSPNLSTESNNLDAIQVHNTRRKLLQKWAFKAFVPAHVAPRAGTPTGGSTTVEGGIKPIRDPDDEPIEFLPMKSVAIYDEDIEKLGGPMMFTGQEEEPEKGDRGPYRIMEPIIRSQSVGQYYFDTISQLDREFQRLTEHARDMAEWARQGVGRYESKVRDYGKILKKASTELESGYDSEVAKSKYFQNEGINKGGNVVNLEKDIEKLSGFRGGEFGQITHQLFLENMTEKEWEAKAAAERLNQLADDYRQKVTQFESVVSGWKTKIDSLKTTYEKKGQFAAWGNIPFGVVPEGSARIVDPRIGLIMFSEVQGHMLEPFMLTREAAVLGMEALVDVTYGYSSQCNSIVDLSAVLLTQEEAQIEDGLAGADISIVVANIATSSPIAAKPVQAPTMTLYEDEQGFPMNETDICTHAIDRGGHHLQQSRSSSGYISTFSGFQAAVLDSGFTGVQYEWAATGGGRPHTVVSVNCPGGVFFGGASGKTIPERRDYVEQFLP